MIFKLNPHNRFFLIFNYLFTRIHKHSIDTIENILFYKGIIDKIYNKKYAELKIHIYKIKIYNIKG